MNIIRNSILVLALFNVFQCLGQNYFAMGNQAMNDKDYVKAEEYYQLAFAEEPTNYTILTHIAFAIHKQKRYLYADSLLNIAALKDSTNSKPFWYAGLNNIKLERDSIVILKFKKFISLEKSRGGNLIAAYRYIGAAYQRMLYKDGLTNAQLEDMIFHLEQIERIDPSNPEVENIKNFIELVNKKRPATIVGKWKMEQ